jgi:phage I-like protein
LTAAEREMADMMGMKHDDYAKNKIALQKEGKLQ